LIAPRSRKCVICGNTFFPIKYTKGGLSPRKTCSQECRLKLHHQQRRQWKPDEIQLLREIAETLPTAQMIRVFNRQNALLGHPKRTAQSIKLKIHELGLSLRPQYVYSANSLGRTLGISGDAVRYWLKLGLEATRQSQMSNSPHYITNVAVRRFARKRPELFGGLNRIDLYIALEDEKLVDFILENYPNRNQPLKPPNRVRCIETGRIYNSYTEAGKAVFVTRSGIFKAIKFGSAANGYHFELVDK
jgi:hypothetical protein